MKELVFDIETNGLLDVITTIHCLTIADVETNELYTFHDSDQLDRSGTLLEGLTLLAKAEVIIGHNIINFDIPAIQKIYPQFNNSFKKYHDTFILSQMLYPNEMQMHGLEAWGRVIGIAKPEHEDWSKLTEEMLVRNKEDVKINTVIWNKFKAEIQNPMWDKAVALEYKVYETYTKHQTYWYIDVLKLQKYIKLLSRLYNIYERYILSQAPMQVIKSETVINPLKKDGMFSSKAIKFAQENNIPTNRITGEYCPVKFEEFNMRSSAQKVAWLLSLGWKPDTFNYKTDKNGKTIRDENGNEIVSSPSLRDSSFFGIPGTLQKVLQNSNKCYYNLKTLERFDSIRFDGNKIPTFALTTACNTTRWKHRGLVNIPKAEKGVYFGKQMRSLFIAPEGYKLVGCDSSQLEARIEGHFTHKYDQGVYAAFLLTQDIHQFNADSWGLTRSEAKAPNYAMAYQCSWKKIMQILDCDEQRAKDIWNKYWEDRPSMVQLIKDLEDSVIARGQAIRTQNGQCKLKTSVKPWIRSIDGRKLYVRSSHSLKNTLIQSAGMISMKIAYVLLAKWIKEQNLDARICMMYHDEYQIIVKDDQAQIDKVMDLAVKAIQKAGEVLNLKVPLTGEAKCGMNWATTH